MTRDADGRIWIGTAGGLTVFSDGRFRSYTTAITAARLGAIRANALVPPRDGRRAALRVYDAPGHFVEREYDPMSTQPNCLSDFEQYTRTCM